MWVMECTGHVEEPCHGEFTCSLADACSVRELIERYFESEGHTR